MLIEKTENQQKLIEICQPKVAEKTPNNLFLEIVERC